MFDQNGGLLIAAYTTDSSLQVSRSRFLAYQPANAASYSWMKEVNSNDKPATQISVNALYTYALVHFSLSQTLDIVQLSNGLQKKLLYFDNNVNITCGATWDCQGVFIGNIVYYFSIGPHGRTYIITYDPDTDYFDFFQIGNTANYHWFSVSNYYKPPASSKYRIIATLIDTAETSHALCIQENSALEPTMKW